MSKDKFILKKYILPEEQDGLTCPLCKHSISCTGGIGHSCYLDSKKTDTKIFWCNYCHLEILIPVEESWATTERKRRSEEMYLKAVNKGESEALGDA